MAASPSARRIKALRIIARLNTGGPARHVVALGKGLAARGYETLVVHGSVGEGEGSLEHLIADSATPGLRRLKLEQLGPRPNVLDDLRALVALVRLIRRERPDIVHTHTAKAGMLGRLAAAVVNVGPGGQPRIVVIHTFHGHVLSEYFSPLVSFGIRLVERGLAQLSDRIVTISKAQRDDIVHRFRVAPAAKTVVVPLGLDLDTLLGLHVAAPSLRSSLGIPNDNLVVGFIGRFVPIKDLPTMLRAFAAGVRQCPNLWLVLAGDGPLRPSLESMARALEIVRRVRFIGWTDDLSRFYSTIDVCAISSLNEGTPVALIEAMAAGRAVVATSVGGVPDLVEHGRTGILVRPRDVDALAAAFVELAGEPSQRGRLGAAARESVAMRYSDARLVEDVDKLYREVLAESGHLPLAAR